MDEVCAARDAYRCGERRRLGGWFLLTVEAWLKCQQQASGDHGTAGDAGQVDRCGILVGWGLERFDADISNVMA